MSQARPESPATERLVQAKKVINASSSCPPRGTPRTAPTGGQHNDELISGHGLFADAIRELQDTGVVGAENLRVQGRGSASW